MYNYETLKITKLNTSNRFFRNYIQNNSKFKIFTIKYIYYIKDNKNYLEGLTELRVKHNLKLEEKNKYISKKIKEYHLLLKQDIELVRIDILLKGRF